MLPHLPAKLTLFDDFAGTLSVPMAGAISVIVVHRSPLLDALSALFEAYWERATPLGLDGLDTTKQHDDEQMIRLLAAGLGDDAIQRALGVSGSTVYRRVHALMSRVGARTRFQAGFQLGRMYPDRQAESQPRARHGARERSPRDISRATRRTTA